MGKVSGKANAGARGRGRKAKFIAKTKIRKIAAGKIRKRKTKRKPNAFIQYYMEMYAKYGGNFLEVVKIAARRWNAGKVDKTKYQNGRSGASNTKILKTKKPACKTKKPAKSKARKPARSKKSKPAKACKAAKSKPPKASKAAKSKPPKASKAAKSKPAKASKAAKSKPSR